MNARTLLARVLHLVRMRGGITVMRVYSRPLGRASRVSCLQPGVSIRILEADELVAWAGDAEMDLREAQIRAAYGRGGLCIGAVVDGKLVAYTWLAFSPTPHINGVWVETGPTARYSYKSFVHPAYRGKRILQALHAFADGSDLRRGRNHAIDLVDLENFNSCAALERAGSRLAGFVGYLGCFGAFVAFRSRGARECGVRLFRESSGRAPRQLRATLRGP